MVKETGQGKGSDIVKTNDFIPEGLDVGGFNGISYISFQLSVGVRIMMVDLKLFAKLIL